MKIYVSKKDDIHFINDVVKSLNHNTIFKEFYYFNRLSSTQDYAYKIIKMKKNISPSVIICKTQSRGRGRTGNRWSSKIGGIWMSIIIETDLEIQILFIFVMICAICICETIETETNLTTQLKWPNDIFINGKKIAGFLIDIEALDGKYCIINGIGINTNNDLPSTILEIQHNDPLSYDITTLKKELNDLEIPNNTFLSKLLNNLDVFFSGILSHSFDYGTIFNAYKKRILESKKKLNYVFKKENDKEFDGEIIDLYFDGSLLVKDIQQNKMIQISSAYSVNLNKME